MKRIYFNAAAFWLILLVIALANATLRETTYKPLLTPYIGIWAHQLSAVIGIIAFYVAIYWFLKQQKFNGTRRQLLIVGLLWIGMTILFECWMNIVIRKLTVQEVLKTYYFWKGDLWFFVLLSLTISPQLANQQLRKHH